MDGFTFFKSYYESAQHLNDEDQAMFYKLIMDYMFTGDEPVLDGHLMGFWLLVKPNLDTSKARSKAGQTESKQNQNRIKRKSNTKPSPLEDKDKDKDIGVIPKGININAWEEFIQHRKQMGKKLTKLSCTKLFNFLLKNEYDQEEIINQSIQNGWAGLFELKKQKVTKSSNPTHDAIDKYFAQQQGEIIDAQLD